MTRLSSNIIKPSIPAAQTLVVIIVLLFAWVPASGTGTQMQRDIVSMTENYVSGHGSLEQRDTIMRLFLDEDNLTNIFETASLMYNSERDATDRLYGSTLLGISYLYRHDIDSCLYYLNNSLFLASNIGDKDSGEFDLILSTTYNNLGLCYINLTTDYYKASGYFLESLKYIDPESEPGTYTAVLSNITIAHYFLDDPSGLYYAQICYDFTKKHNVSPFLADYCMALMEFVSGNYTEAENYAEHALTVLEHMPESQSVYRDMIAANIIYGKALMASGKEAAAGRAFSRAVGIPADPAYADVVGANVYYGDYFIHIGDDDRALSVFLDAVDLSHESSNYAYLDELYSRISKLYEKKGDEAQALVWYKRFDEVKDSIFNATRDFALSEIKAKYRLEQYQNELRISEITILKKEKSTQVMLLLFLLSSVSAVLIWLIMYQKNKYYERIVRQYRDSVNLRKQVREHDAVPSDDRHDVLYQELLRLMDIERLYRDKDITLDKLSAVLKTNRSYLSKTINEHSGRNFNKFINKYRISEAIERLSKSDEDCLLKAMATDLGFNSPSTFYKAFYEETGVSPSVYRKKIIELSRKETSR